MTNNRLHSYAERIERILDAIDEHKADIKEIYQEVKAADFSTPALRGVIAEKRKKTNAELEARKEEYRAALGMPGATYRSVADKLKVPKSTLHRLVPREENGTDHEIENAVPLGDDQASNGLPAQVDGLTEPRQPGGDGRVSSAGTDDLAFPAHLDRRVSA